MATFYMQGSDVENQAVSYFDSMYIPVQEIIDLDGTMQENLDTLLFTDEGFESITDEHFSFAALDKSYKKLFSFVKERKDEYSSINIFKEEENLKNAYIQLVNAYYDELTTRFIKIIAIIKKVNPSETEKKEFNELLNLSQTYLDSELEKFYSSASSFAQKYQIEIVEE